MPPSRRFSPPFPPRTQPPINLRCMPEPPTHQASNAASEGRKRPAARISATRTNDGLFRPVTPRAAVAGGAIPAPRVRELSVEEAGDGACGARIARPLAAVTTPFDNDRRTYCSRGMAPSSPLPPISERHRRTGGAPLRRTTWHGTACTVSCVRVMYFSLPAPRVRQTTGRASVDSSGTHTPFCDKLEDKHVVSGHEACIRYNWAVRRLVKAQTWSSVY